MLGRVAGIPVRLHWTFFLLPILVVVADETAGWRAVVVGLLWIVALFGSVVLHELAHSVVARHQGCRVRDIVLFPLGGVSELEEMPAVPRDELVMAAAGPAVSVVLGTAFLVVGLAAGSQVWPPTLFAGSWWARLGWLNLLLGAFNLLPALPMDGGRMLRASLARHQPRAVATAHAARLARWLGAAMIVVGFLYDFWLIFIGLLVVIGANAEEVTSRRTPPGSGPRPDDRGLPPDGTDGHGTRPDGMEDRDGR